MCIGLAMASPHAAERVSNDMMPSNDMVPSNRPVAGAGALAPSRR